MSYRVADEMDVVRFLAEEYDPSTRWIVFNRAVAREAEGFDGVKFGEARKAERIKRDREQGIVKQRRARPATAAASVRFVAFVQPSDGCWLWQGTAAGGYGLFGPNREDKGYAHRYAWELVHGPIPDGLTLDHLCRTPICVNPWHLEPVTMRENLLRGDGPPARNARMTHCKNGHPFDEANTYVWRNTRRCRTCCRENGRRKNRA